MNRQRKYYTFTHTGIFSHNKEWNAVICNNMNGRWGHYAKWDKSDRERQILYDLTYMWNLKKQTNKQTKTLTHRNRDQVENNLLSKYS